MRSQDSHRCWVTLQVCVQNARRESGKVNRDLFGIITDSKDFVAPGPAG